MPNSKTIFGELDIHKTCKGVIGAIRAQEILAYIDGLLNPFGVLSV